MASPIVTIATGKPDSEPTIYLYASSVLTANGTQGKEMQVDTRWVLDTTCSQRIVKGRN